MISTEDFLKTVIDRAVKKIICTSLEVPEDDFNPKAVEYYTVWKRRVVGDKSLSRLKIRQNRTQDFSEVPMVLIEDEGLLWDDVIEYLIENRSKKISPKDFMLENRFIYS